MVESVGSYQNSSFELVDKKNSWNKNKKERKKAKGGKNEEKSKERERKKKRKENIKYQVLLNCCFSQGNYTKKEINVF